MSKLKQAITIIKTDGDKSEAQELIAQHLEETPDSLNGWLWMSRAVTNVEDKLMCFEQTLVIDPDNETAHRNIARLQAQLAKQAATADMADAESQPKPAQSRRKKRTQAEATPPAVTVDYEAARKKLSSPTSFLISVTAFSIAIFLAGLLFNLWLIQNEASIQIDGFQVDQPIPLTVPIGLTLFMVTFNAIIILGALRMRRLQSRAWGMLACFLALIPCFGPCFIFGIPFGLWGLWMLRDDDVRAAFNHV